MSPRLPIGILAGVVILLPYSSLAFDPKIDPASREEFLAYLDCAGLYKASEEREFDAAEKEKLNVCITKYGDKILEKGEALASMPRDDQFKTFQDSIYNQYEMNKDGWVNG